MAQTYTPVGWKDSPSTDTPINSTNLKHMDDAIKDLYEGAATTNEIIISDTQPTSEDNKLWIDTGEIAQQVSEITNEYSTSTGLGYSANYVNDLHTYSTTEHRVGTWIDGKPLYRKIVTKQFDSTIGGTGQSQYDIEHNISNIDLCVNCIGRLLSTAGAVFPFPAMDGDANGVKLATFVNNFNDQYIRLRIDNDTWSTSVTFYFECYYTKTTD